MIEVCFLGSGSSGNCAVVRSGRTAVLLDAGLSARETGRRLGARGALFSDVGAVFVTHEHSDHVHGALSLSQKWEVPLYATAGTARAASLPGPLFADVRTVADGREVVLGGGELTVRVTSTPHDGTESVCYVFADGGGCRVGIVTDLGHLSPAVIEALRDCEVLGLEANHDVELLRTGPYPVYLKRRILSDVGHLSNAAAAEGLGVLVGPRTRAIVALHVSLHNNTEGLAARALRGALERLGASLPLAVARHDEPTAWFGAGEDGARGEVRG